MPLSTVVNTMSSSQDFNGFNDSNNLNNSNNLNDSNNSLTKLNTQGIDFRSLQFRLGEKANIAQTETQAIIILPFQTSD